MDKLKMITKSKLLPPGITVVSLVAFNPSGKGSYRDTYRSEPLTYRDWSRSEGPHYSVVHRRRGSTLLYRRPRGYRAVVRFSEIKEMIL